MQLKLVLLKGTYSIYRFDPDANVPDWIHTSSDFIAMVRTGDELSVICKDQDHAFVKTSVHNKDWRILKIKGPLDLSLTGIIAEISGLLAKKEIPVFTISTYDTDYILIKNQDTERAIEALEAKRHKVHTYI